MLDASGCTVIYYYLYMILIKLKHFAVQFVCEIMQCNQIRIQIKIKMLSVEYFVASCVCLLIRLAAVENQFKMNLDYSLCK